MAIESCGTCGSQRGHLPNCQHFERVTFKVELAEKIGKINGRTCAVGNLYGVGRYINGRRNNWALAPQKDEDLARSF